MCYAGDYGVDFNANYDMLTNGRKKKASADPRDRAKGAIAGMCIADALGSPIEFHPKTGHEWVTEMLVCPHWRLGKGFYTDDAAMGLNIMQGFLDDPKNYKVENVAEAFAKWLYKAQWSSANFTFGIGSNCGAGIRNFVEKGCLKNGGEDAQGNGAIMRFAPSWFVAQKVAKTAKARLNVMNDINDIDHDSSVCRKTIKVLDEIFKAHMNGFRSDIATTATSWKDAKEGGWCVATLDSAIWAFNITNNFEDAVIASINLGGDADSRGSVTGQIAGAYYGYKAIPKRWIADMNNWDKTEKFIDEFLDAVGY